MANGDCCTEEELPLTATAENVVVHINAVSKIDVKSFFICYVFEAKKLNNRPRVHSNRDLRIIFRQMIFSRHFDTDLALRLLFA